MESEYTQDLTLRKASEGIAEFQSQDTFLHCWSGESYPKLIQVILPGNKYI